MKNEFGTCLWNSSVRYFGKGHRGRAVEGPEDTKRKSYAWCRRFLAGILSDVKHTNIIRTRNEKEHAFFYKPLAGSNHLA